MRLWTTPILLLLSFALWGCGDSSSEIPVQAGGSGGEAGASPEAGEEDSATSEGQAGSAGDDGGLDAQPQDANPADAAQEEAAEPVCPSLALTDQEKQLIESGDASEPMTIVTNQTEEGNSFLHQKACPLDPTDPTVLLLIERLRKTLAASVGGVGIAGPQVGISRRLFLAERDDLEGSPIVAFLNPTITEYSTETKAAAEGCLSVPGKQPKVTRSLWVTVDYVREDGTSAVGETIGSTTNTVAAFSARIVQHEYDHLLGVLIVDK